jgi:L-aspartate semialdehyde sulfurtransferase ferredoxin
MEDAVIDKKIRLLYPPTLVNVPIIHQLIKQFDITINILRAEINPDQGWVEIQVTGNDAVLKKALEWLSSQGIEVQVIE